MKKLFFAVSALAALALLAPSTGFAQVDPGLHQFDNVVGMFTTADGNGETSTNQMSTPVDVYVVLLRPAESVGGERYATINAFEFTLQIDPAPQGQIFKLKDDVPPGSVDVGAIKDFNNGTLEYIVGVSDSSPVVVTDGAAVLVSYTFLNNSVGGFDFYIEPVSIPSIADNMAFQSVAGELRTMWPASDDWALPIFSFNGEAVPVDEASFGSVKALFC